MAGGPFKAVIRGAIACLVLVAAGCGAARTSHDPAGIADSITRAIYANDYDGTTARLDHDTKAEVTRGEIGDLSDRMRVLGTYQGLTQVKADPDRGLYDFDLHFSHGHMTARMRMDPSGKVGAYRVFPNGTATSTPSA